MGSKFSANISNSTVGAVAVGDEAKAVGQVIQGSSSSSQPQAPAAASQGSGATQQAGDVPIDFAILTAIEVERRAVCAAFGLGDDHRVKKGARVYWRGRLPLKTVASDRS